MAVLDLMALGGKRLFAALARLSPLLPISILLGLERWVVSNVSFSRAGLLAFRAAYLICVVLALFATYTGPDVLVTTMKTPEYRERPEALENFKGLATAILQAPIAKQKRQTKKCASPKKAKKSN
jgi:hypothetical protein